jgi:hypothetical protein
MPELRDVIPAEAVRAAAKTMYPGAVKLDPGGQVFDTTLRGILAFLDAMGVTVEQSTTVTRAATNLPPFEQRLVSRWLPMPVVLAEDDR